MKEYKGIVCVYTGSDEMDKAGIVLHELGATASVGGDSLSVEAIFDRSSPNAWRALARVVKEFSWALDVAEVNWSDGDVSVDRNTRFERLARVRGSDRFDKDELDNLIGLPVFSIANRVHVVITRAWQEPGQLGLCATFQNRFVRPTP